MASPGEAVTGDPAGLSSGSVAAFHGGSGGLVPQATSWSGLSLRTDVVWPLWYGRRLAAAQTGGLNY
ncbi:hypothetical protein [Micromonospora sp. NPDC003816]|uniref:hypothetical protein n=1 Tax=Micromonospora sp. NPDC003816 TaxID=3364224 RepID=UPI0036BC14A8